MPRTRAGNHAAKQLLRSGTSPLPNHGEAQAAESRDDFLHKMRICLKELRETKRWLLLLQRVPLVKSPTMLAPLLRETEELIQIFVAFGYSSDAHAECAAFHRRTGRIIKLLSVQEIFDEEHVQKM